MVADDDEKGVDTSEADFDVSFVAILGLELEVIPVLAVAPVDVTSCDVDTGMGLGGDGILGCDFPTCRAPTPREMVTD